MKRLLWDLSHQEFSLSDHYYFSKLQNFLFSWDVDFEESEEPLSLKKLSRYDILVLCYPEKPFSSRERKIIRKFMERGGRVIVAGYFRSSDKMAYTCNSLTEDFAIKLRDDQVKDPIHCLEGDPLLLTTSRVSRELKDISRIFFPCSASLEIGKGVEVLIWGEESARSDVWEGEVILSAKVKVGMGELIVLGTCVFWDNFAIEKFDNIKLCEKLLS
ncbi:MAG: DUF4350 domain-containing protein [bacterium]